MVKASQRKFPHACSTEPATASRACALIAAALFLGACGAGDRQAADIGLQMYRDGLLASGEAMTAIVGGDVPVIGTQFSCNSCHGRSGMGASEGAYVIPPIAAQFLFAESAQPRRPAYDRAGLARVLRDGVTPSGRQLSPELMPRYELSDDEVDALATYLETLSAGNSPGVDDTVIRFATIVSDDTDTAERDAVLAVFNRFFEEINRQTRNESGRWDRGYTPESKLPTVFREWVLDEWTLTGPPEEWGAQLDGYYARNPVFAVAGGLGGNSWAPVSRFCERNRIPCLYPSVDLPHREPEDFYTVYFSAGLLLEADLAAAHLAGAPAASLLQVYCDERLRPALERLRDSVSATGTAVRDSRFECGGALPVDDIAATLNDGGAAVLWTRADDYGPPPEELPPGRLYVSSTLSGVQLSLEAAGPVYALHPFRLPDRSDPAVRRVEIWARTRDIDITVPRRQAEAFFACLVLKDAVKHMGRFFVREYALDMMDHKEGLSAYVPLYARPSFGPGQRFISKGGYVVPLVDGRLATEDAVWISP